MNLNDLLGKSLQLLSGFGYPNKSDVKPTLEGLENLSQNLNSLKRKRTTEPIKESDGYTLFKKHGINGENLKDDIQNLKPETIVPITSQNVGNSIETYLENARDFIYSDSMAQFNRRVQSTNQKYINSHMDNLWKNETDNILKKLRGETRYLNILDRKSSNIDVTQIQSTEESILLKTCDCIYKYRNNKQQLFLNLSNITKDNLQDSLLLDSWNILELVFGENISEYTSREPSLTTKLSKSITYLELSYKNFLMKELELSLDQSESLVELKVKHEMNLHPTFFENVTLASNGLPLWFQLYLYFRLGNLNKFIDLLQDSISKNSKLINDDKVVIAMENFANKNTSNIYLQLQSRYLSLLESKVTDLYQLAIYSILCNKEITKLVFINTIYTTIDDFIWMKLNIIVHPNNNDRTEVLYQQLISLIDKFGPNHFTANGNRPLVYFKILLLLCQYEQSLQYLVDNNYLYYAIHFGIIIYLNNGINFDSSIQHSFSFSQQIIPYLNRIKSIDMSYIPIYYLYLFNRNDLPKLLRMFINDYNDFIKLVSKLDETREYLDTILEYSGRHAEIDGDYLKAEELYHNMQDKTLLLQLYINQLTTYILRSGYDWNFWTDKSDQLIEEYKVKSYENSETYKLYILIHSINRFFMLFMERKYQIALDLLGNDIKLTPSFNVSLQDVENLYKTSDYRVKQLIPNILKYTIRCMIEILKDEKQLLFINRSNVDSTYYLHYNKYIDLCKEIIEYCSKSDLNLSPGHMKDIHELYGELKQII